MILFAFLMFLHPPVPGATDPKVTQANIGTTICARGYSRTVRPPLAYTSALKRRLYRAGHLHGGLRAYELDHRVPLEVGGAPRDHANLWLEPIRDARVKDRLENKVHAEVCAGTLSLAEGQKVFLTP